MASTGVRLVVIALAASQVAACSRLRGGWHGFWGPERTEKQSEASTTPAHDVPPPQVEPLPEPTPQSAAAVPAPEPKQRPMIEAHLEPPPPPTRLSERLSGLDFDAVRGLMGEPVAIKEVPPGQEWLYRDGECTLTIRFFPEMEKLHYRALSVSVHEEGQTDGDQNRCHERFVARLKP